MQDYFQRKLDGDFSGSLDPFPNVALDAGLNLAYIVRPREILGNIKWDGKPGPISEPEYPVGDLYNALADPIFRDIDIGEDPFDGGFSIWFLVRDLWDLKKLSLSIVKILSSRGELRTLEGTFSKVAESHVVVQYGLSPTIDDMKTFVNVVKKLCNAFTGKGQFSKLYTAHSKMELAPAKSFSRTGTYQRDLFSGAVVCDYVQKPIMAYLTLKYYFVCPELTGFANRLRAAADLLGIVDLAGLWDLLPWSFVVDWFFDVQTFLHKHLRHRFLPVDICVVDACQSVHINGDVRTSMSGKWGWSQDDISGVAPLSTKVNQLFADSTYYMSARRRVFPYPIRINPPKIKRGTGITIRRVIIGSAIVGLRSQVHPRFSRAAHYRSRAPHLSSNRASALREKNEQWRFIRG